MVNTGLHTHSQGGSEGIRDVILSTPPSAIVDASEEDSGGIVRGVRKGYDDREVAVEDDDGVMGELPLPMAPARSNASMHLPSMSSSPLAAAAAVAHQSPQQLSILPSIDPQPTTVESVKGEAVVNDSTVISGPVYRSKSMRFTVPAELSLYADSVGFDDAVALYRNAAQLSINSSSGTTSSVATNISLKSFR